MAESLARLVDALQAHGRNPRNGKARCPIHGEDHNPSLSYGHTGDRTVMFCHVCGRDRTPAILDALGLSLPDLYDEPKGRYLASYEYRTAAGKLARTVHRTAGKEFPQTIVDKAPILYRLPEVLAAVDAGKPVYLVEGEEDVHALETLGVVATTAPMGAGNFGKVDITPLKGADVIAIPDQDSSGQRWRADVTGRIDGYAKSLTVLAPKAGKDASDHVAAGYSIDEFGTSTLPNRDSVPNRDVVEQGKGQRDTRDTTTPESPESRTERLLGAVRDGAWLDSQEFAPLNYAVPGLLPEGFTVLVGAPKVGKSWLIGGILLSVAAGGAALGKLRLSSKRRVLYLALEDGDRRMQSRCRKLLGDGEALPVLFHYVTRVDPIEVLHTIEAFLDRYPDTVLVVLDTLGKVMPPAGPNETTYQRDYRVGGRIKDIADQRPGLAIVAIHHDRKAGAADFVERVSGTNGLAGAADTIIVLDRSRQSTEGLLAVTGRDVPESEYALKMVDGVSWTLDGNDLAEAAATARKRQETAAGQVSDLSMDIIEFVRSHEDGVTRAQVVEKFGDNAGRYLARHTHAGRLVRKARGRYDIPDRVPSVPLSQTGHDQHEDMGQERDTLPDCPEDEWAEWSA